MFYVKMQKMSYIRLVSSMGGKVRHILQWESRPGSYGCRRPDERYTISSTGPGNGEGVRRSALVLGFTGGDPCAPTVRSVRSRPCGDGRSLTTRTPASL